MLRSVPAIRLPQPGYVTTYPNREKSESKATRVIVSVILIISAILMVAVTIGGWSKLQGLTWMNFTWAAVYVVIAYFVTARWARGLLPIAGSLAIILLIISLIAGLGGAGTSWFDRNATGYAAAQSLFGGTGLSATMLGLLTLLIAPVQVLLIIFCTRGMAQRWNVELERPAHEVAGDAQPTWA